MSPNVAQILADDVEPNRWELPFGLQPIVQSTIPNSSK